MTHSILKNFLPYIWYDIALYPKYARINHSERAPSIDVILKYYNAKSDGFEFYKERGITYVHNSSQAKDWIIRENHRVIAFMHDGQDLPDWDSKHDWVNEPALVCPPFATKTIAQLEREASPPAEPDDNNAL